MPQELKGRTRRVAAMADAADAAALDPMPMFDPTGEPLAVPMFGWPPQFLETSMGWRPTEPLEGYQGPE